MEAKETKWLYETILSGPGMGEEVKFSFSASRKVILLLAEVIENGLTFDGSGLKESVGEDSIKELKQIKGILLEKSNLTALSNQLLKIK